MVSSEVDMVKIPDRKKIRKILSVIAVFISLIIVILFIIPPIIPNAVFIILLSLLLFDIFSIVWFSTLNYNMGIAFLVTIIAAIIFRRMRWPFTAPLFAIGFTGLACFSFLYAEKFLTKFNHHKFLKYIGFASSIILSIVSMGLLWNNVHWPFADLILNTGLVLFIPFLFAFIFSLPSSDYLSWNQEERRLFFRVIIIPMSFVYILALLMIVFPEIYRAMTRVPLTPFNLNEVELLIKPGLY